MAKMRREDYEDELAEDKEVREEVSWHATDQKHLSALKKRLEESASVDEEAALERRESNKRAARHEELMRSLAEDSDLYAEECELQHQRVHYTKSQPTRGYRIFND